MILNRQFIKILEDLGVQRNVFMDLQNTAVERLRHLTTTPSPVNSAKWLEELDCPKATRLPSLVEMLSDIGLDYRADGFLSSVVEIVVVTLLRDIKYRGRIPVAEGYKLYGIMDETGYLKENEIFVSAVCLHVSHWRIPNTVYSIGSRDHANEMALRL